jgi:hypothetical protein
MAFFNYVNPWPETTHWPLRCSAPGDGMPPCGRADFVPEISCGDTCCILHMGLSTGCRLPVAQAVAAAAVRCFGSTMGSFCMIANRQLPVLVTQYDRNPGAAGGFGFGRLGPRSDLGSEIGNRKSGKPDRGPRANNQQRPS